MTFIIISLLIHEFHFIEKPHKCYMHDFFLLRISIDLLSLAKNDSTYILQVQFQQNY